MKVAQRTCHPRHFHAKNHRLISKHLKVRTLTDRQTQKGTGWEMKISYHPKVLRCGDRDGVWLYIGKERWIAWLKIIFDKEEGTVLLAKVENVNKDGHEHNAGDEEWYFKAPFQQDMV